MSLSFVLLQNKDPEHLLSVANRFIVSQGLNMTQLCALRALRKKQHEGKEYPPWRFSWFQEAWEMSKEVMQVVMAYQLLFPHRSKKDRRVFLFALLPVALRSIEALGKQHGQKRVEGYARNASFGVQCLSATVQAFAGVRDVTSLFFGQRRFHQKGEAFEKRMFFVAWITALTFAYHVELLRMDRGIYPEEDHEE